MKVFFFSLGAVLGVASAAAAVTLLPMLMKMGSLSPYESGQLGGRFFITMMLLIGCILAVKKGRKQGSQAAE